MSERLCSRMADCDLLAQRGGVQIVRAVDVGVLLEKLDAGEYYMDESGVWKRK